MLPFHQIQSWVLAWGMQFIFGFVSFNVFVTNNGNRNETYADKKKLNKSFRRLVWLTWRTTQFDSRTLLEGLDQVEDEH